MARQRPNSCPPKSKWRFHRRYFVQNRLPVGKKKSFSPVEPADLKLRLLTSLIRMGKVRKSRNVINAHYMLNCNINKKQFCGFINTNLDNCNFILFINWPKTIYKYKYFKWYFCKRDYLSFKSQDTCHEKTTKNCL